MTNQQHAQDRAALAAKDARIAELEGDNERLRYGIMRLLASVDEYGALGEPQNYESARSAIREARSALTPTPKARETDTADEYEACAEYHAKHKRLPELVSAACMESINGDPDAFRARVREYAYGQAMTARETEGEVRK